jgi:hypothetical protein
LAEPIFQFDMGYWQGNNMRIRIIMFFMVCSLFFITSCQPAVKSTPYPIIEPTKAAPTATLPPTATPKPTITPTLTPLLYMVTYGYCQTDHALTGDPTRLKECVIKQKKQMELVSGQTIRYSTQQAHLFASFCAIHQTDGKFITAFVDSQKFGEALCVLP